MACTSKKTYRIIKIILLLVLVVFVNSCEKQVSVSPPDEPPPDGAIYITSYPTHFQIFMNGKYRIRSTPDSLKWLSTGTYEILLRKDLFLDTVFAVDVHEGEKSNIFIDLSKNPKMLGSLSIKSKPEGAEIIINDSNTSSTTPFTFNKLLPDIYRVTLKYEKHKDFNIAIPVKSNARSEIEAIMVDTTTWEYFNSGNSGLSAKVLTSLAIDNNDVKWIGTREGVVSFDDKNWNQQFPGTSALTHQVITSISVDSKNAKWITTIGGISIADDMIINRKWSSKDTELGTDYFNQVFIKKASRDVYYFASDIGLVIYAFDSDPFVQRYTWRYVGNILNNELTTVWSGQSGYLVGSRESGLAVNSDTWVKYNRLNSNIPGNSISAMYESQEGIWIGHLPGAGTTGGLSLYTEGTFTNYTLQIPGPNINTIFVDSRNIKWVGTDIGLFAFKDISSKILFNELSTGLPIKDVTGIAEDSKGKIWFIIKDNGFFEVKKIPL